MASTLTRWLWTIAVAMLVAQPFAALATSGIAPPPRADHSAVWTGSEMIIWGGRTSNGVFNTGGRYNPNTDSWSQMSTNGAPSARQNHTAIWSGTEMIVYGGLDFSTGIYFPDGARYNPSNDIWTVLPVTNRPSPRADHTAVWTGNSMIIWGGASNSVLVGEVYLKTGARYWAASNTWTALQTNTLPYARVNHSAIWTGSNMVVFGGVVDDLTNDPYKDNSGGRYYVTSNSWLTTLTNTAPTNRTEHTSIWTGSNMIVWGGLGNGTLDYLNSGGRYHPGSNTWTATATNNAPTIRQSHTAVWTGTEMIVWGGRAAGNFRNNGGRYDAVGNVWTATSATGAPAARANHTAVWTGSEMILFGGENSSGMVAGLARYHAPLGAWTFPPAATITSPTHGAVISSGTNTSIVVATTDTDNGGAANVDYFANGVLLGSRQTQTNFIFHFTWGGATSGVYSLTAIATDGPGTKGTSAPVSVTVVAAPSVALVTPASAAQFPLGGSIPMEASAASSGASLSRVDFYRGATLLGSDTTSPYQFNLTNAPLGSNSLTARAVDSLGVTNTSAAIPITVLGPPVVSLTAPANNAKYPTPGNISLAASASSTGGTIAEVQFYSGSTLLGIDASNPYTFDWSGIATGAYALTARAVDGFGVVATSAIVNVTVVAPPAVTLTAPTNNAAVSAPGTFNLAANASSSGATITTVEFYQGATLLGTDAVAPYQWTWTNVSAATYSLTARALDNLGMSNTSAAVTVSVIGPPAVALLTPTNNAQFGAPANVSISANASSAAGAIASVKFYRDATLVSTVTNAPYAMTWSNAASGAYSLTARATDNFGVIATSAPVAITVSSPPSVALASPFVNLVYPQGTPIPLAATASDTDGTVTQVDFLTGATLIGSTTNSPFTFNWTNAPFAVHSLTARATDNSGAVSTSAPVSITVNAFPLVAFTGLPASVKVILHGTLNLTAAASDPDGTVAQVEFRTNGIPAALSLTPPHTLPWSNDTLGSYILTAIATDNLGFNQTSAPVTLEAVLKPNLEVVFSSNKYRLLLSGGEPGRAYVVQFTTNFAAWSNLRTNVAADGTFNIIDTNANSQSRRFYRATP